MTTAATMATTATTDKLFMSTKTLVIGGAILLAAILLYKRVSTGTGAQSTTGSGADSYLQQLENDASSIGGALAGLSTGYDDDDDDSTGDTDDGSND